MKLNSRQRASAIASPRAFDLRRCQDCALITSKILFARFAQRGEIFARFAQRGEKRAIILRGASTHAEQHRSHWRRKLPLQFTPRHVPLAASPNSNRPAISLMPCEDMRHLLLRIHEHFSRGRVLQVPEKKHHALIVLCFMGGYFSEQSRSQQKKLFQTGRKVWHVRGWGDGKLLRSLLH